MTVWPFQPDWSDGVTERLEWRSEVLQSETLNEQALATRLTPRRMFEAKFGAIVAERSYLASFIRLKGSEQFMLPLWQNRGELTADAAAGASSLSLDTSYLEFTAGGMALLVGADALSSEAVTIATVGPSAITLSAPTVNAWKSGAVVQPLRLARLDGEQAQTLLTSSVTEGTLTFRLESDNPIDAGAETFPLYGGIPVMTTAPNWSQAIDITAVRNLFMLDQEVGRVGVTDAGLACFESRKHGWFLYGRAEHWAFRQWLYRMAGRTGAVWLPSFADDVTLVTVASPGAGYIDVKPAGLAALGVPALGRDHLWLNGQALAISSMSGSPPAGAERALISPSLSGSAAVADTASFLEVARFDADLIEIHHETDTSGLATVEIPFRTIPNSRTLTSPDYLPVPSATMNSSPCGGALRCEFVPSPDTFVWSQYTPSYAHLVSAAGTYMQVWNTSTRTLLFSGPPPEGVGWPNAVSATGIIAKGDSGVWQLDFSGSGSLIVAAADVHFFDAGCTWAGGAAWFYPSPFNGMSYGVLGGGLLATVPTNFWPTCYCDTSEGGMVAVGYRTGENKLAIAFNGEAVATLIDTTPFWSTTGDAFAFDNGLGSLVVSQGSRFHLVNKATRTITASVVGGGGDLRAFTAIKVNSRKFWIGWTQYDAVTLATLRTENFADWTCVGSFTEIGQPLYDPINNALVEGTSASPQSGLVYRFLT